MKRKTDNFSKFYNKKRNSAIKEEFRQEKKAAKKERKEAIERHFEEKRRASAPPEKESHFKKLPGKTKPPTLSLKRDAGAPAKTPAGTPAKSIPGKSAKSIPGTSAKSIPGTPAKSIPGIPAKSIPGAIPPKAGAPVKPVPGTSPAKPTTPGETLPLNKYIAHGGICSRRDAADLIRSGKVSVNGQVITEPGTKVLPTDTVKANGKKVTISRNFVYILLNKPKDYITTTDDPQGRRTVLDLIRHATAERVFPVGRLDRNTSGVLLLTNDGDLAQKLAHPSHEIKKIYHVSLDKPLTKSDFDKIIGGTVHLEDGAAHVDAMAYADSKDKTQIGLEIHSGRNRIVRRIFEHLGYDVRGLDRVMYAGLTKKNVQRGKWRLLTEKEIRILKYLNSSIKGSSARVKDWAATVTGITTPAGAAATGKTTGAATTTRSRKTAATVTTPTPTAASATQDLDQPRRKSATGPGKRPPRSIPPKGRKPAGAPTKSRPHKPTHFNNDGE